MPLPYRVNRVGAVLIDRLEALVKDAKGSYHLVLDLRPARLIAGAIR